MVSRTRPPHPKTMNIADGTAAESRADSLCASPFSAECMPFWIKNDDVGSA